MITKKNILLYGSPLECSETIELLHTIFSPPHNRYQYLPVYTQEDLQSQLAACPFCLAIILPNDSSGMEGVYTVREYDSELPVFWFSNDNGFGIQSHRLECAYFSVKPLTIEKLLRAFQRCAHIGIGKFDIASF